MGGDWIREVRGLLFALAQTTDTPLPPANVQDVYIRQLFKAAGDGRFSTMLISDAVERVIQDWKYPSFPKVADILREMKSVRSSFEFRMKVQSICDKEIPEHATDRPEERKRVVEIIKQWRKEDGRDFGELKRRLEEK